MRHADIIAALGGIGPLAESIGRHRTRVGAWRRTGIPAFLWPDIVDLAQAKGQRDITIDALRAGARDETPVSRLPRGRRPNAQAAA